MAALLRNVALFAMAVSFWGLAHRYRGLGYDAQLYAFQALAKIHPALQKDLFLLHSSQDRFTIFSPFYAFFINALGLANAALCLWLIFTVTLLSSAWFIADRLMTRNIAWLCVFLLVITLGHYGAFAVIHYSEDYLTARTAAEAMVVLALALHLGGKRVLAMTITLIAMMFHPIMALPGLLMLLCLWLPLRICARAAVIGTLAILGIAVAARSNPAMSQVFTVMDAQWLYVVRERSQYLLLDLWKFEDWRVNARSFVSLLLTIMALQDPRIRRLCLSAVLVGATGLAVAAIASFVCPLTILIQAQTWRLVWITVFMSILLLGPTILRVWRDEKCGPLCALLLVLAWTYPIIDNLLSVSLAALLWSQRSRIPERSAIHLRWLALAIGAVATVWMMGNFWTIVSAPFDTGHDPLPLQTVKNILGLQLPLFLLVWAGWYYVAQRTSSLATAVACTALAVALPFILPASFKAADLLSVSKSPEEFADWQALIPETSNVAVITEDSSSFFVWFGLHRTNYLSEAQSAGLVFSRDTALEVSRRSEVLAPLMDPNWKILSSFKDYEKNPRKPRRQQVRPLTAPALIALCQEPLLGFVIAKENIGYGANQHTQRGAWKDWSLYDCGFVRKQAGLHAARG